MIATWNIANLGAQKRRDKDYRLLTEIICWFDVVAVQHRVFDFDGAIFRGFWEARTPGAFRSYVRYYISDHRAALGAVPHLT